MPADDSVIEDESRVETVVVGDESEESEAAVDVLSRGWWKMEKCWLMGLKHVSLVVLKGSFGPLRSWPGAVPTSDGEFAPLSKTDMKEGIGGANARGPACDCMLALSDASRRDGLSRLRRRRCSERRYA